MDILTEMLEKRAKIVADQEAVNNKALEEKRALSAEETQQWEAMNTDFDGVTEKIKEVRGQIEAERKRLEDLETRKAVVKEGAASVSLRPMPHQEEKKEQREVHYTATEEYRKAFNSFLIGGHTRLTSDELRALQADKDTAGGFLVTPQQMAQEIIMKKNDLVFIRPLANVITLTNATSLGAAALDNDPADATWSAEIKTGSADSTMSFEKRELNPHPLAQRLKVSKKLLRYGTAADTIVRDRLAYKFSIVEENAFLNGSGANRPLGVFTASAHGINTDRDVSTGNLSTAITADGLINCKYALKAQYRNNRSITWIFHRDAIKMIRKLKDADGQYLWKQGLSDRTDTILEIPFAESEYAPSTFTTALYVGILGDFSNYWIVDALDMEIQVLTELYAETNQNGYIGRAETDGMPVLSEAFSRVKLA